MGSTKIVEALATVGVDMNGRTVRFHLARLDEEGFTSKISRRMGRVITDIGRRELESANLVRRMRFIVSKIDSMCFDMTFDLARTAGTVVLNFSLVPIEQVGAGLDHIETAFQAGLGMGRLALARAPGSVVGRLVVPKDYVGIGTVCNVTLNGILLKMGIPVTSRYGCLLRIERREPAVFTEMVDYLGSTVDPLGLYIKAGMTSVGRVARAGSGVVGASLREIPANAVRTVEAAHKKIEKLGMGGILTMGRPNQPLLNLPVNEGAVGIALVGGLNPVAAAHEAGIRTENTALHSFVDFHELDTFENLRKSIRKFA